MKHSPSTGIPFGLWLTFGRHWGLAGFWAGLTISVAFASAASGVALVRLVSHVATVTPRPERSNAKDGGRIGQAPDVGTIV